MVLPDIIFQIMLIIFNKFQSGQFYSKVKRMFHFINFRRNFRKIKLKNKIRISFFTGVIMDISPREKIVKFFFSLNIIISFYNGKPQRFAESSRSDKKEVIGRIFYIMYEFCLIYIVTVIFSNFFIIRYSIGNFFRFIFFIHNFVSFPCNKLFH